MSSLNAEIHLRIEAGTPGHFRPYPHQQSAWNALDRHFENGNQAGIVVVPTGGGKTRIASRWLLQNHVRNGGRVLWLAHRRSLLSQAFHTFAHDANLASPLERLGMIRISSDDRQWSQVGEDHHVVFSSVQSAALPACIGFVELFAQQSKAPIFVVVDEAHHASAPSYRRVLSLLKEADAKIIGLTATPIRMDANDNKWLWNMFDHNLIFDINRADLVQSGILATPIKETVETKVEMEREFTPEDFRHLQRYGELAEPVLQRLAKHAGRNQLIVDHYRKNADLYGKTILFAANTLHAQTLATEFAKAGITADYVDYTRKDSGTVMDAFRDREDPVVIANVEMLTEGFDAPRTKSVFIARPTRSEALLSQMVGRALRGTAAGGTDTAYLVTFVDTWKDYNVLDMDVVIADGDPEEILRKKAFSGPLIEISAELIAEAYRLVQSAFRGTFVGVYSCLPYSWFVWEEETEFDVNRRLVLVFENQKECFDRLVQDWGTPVEPPPEITPEFAAHIRRQYFTDIPDPIPSLSDLSALLRAFQQGIPVASYTFDEKKNCDPNLLAVEMRNLTPDDRNRKLQEIFQQDDVCQLIYRNDFQTFREEVVTAIEKLVAPISTTPNTLPESCVPNTAELKRWPAESSGYSLHNLLDAVVSQKLHFPRGTPKISDLRFSASPLTNLWGFFKLSNKSIVISCVLNSPDIPQFVVEFLLYHELLHADMPNSGHNSIFRQRERRFTPSSEAIVDATTRNISPGKSGDAWRILADQFLDTFHRRFHIDDERPQAPRYY